jgi:hypothetical protein
MVTFRCYISSTGDDEIGAWYESQSANVRGAIYAVVEALRARPVDRWRRKPYAELKNRICAGLGEVRVEEPKGVHHRILGFFDPTRSAFTLLYPFGKSGDPAYVIACPKAQKRENDVEQDATRGRECDFPAAGRAGRSIG